MWLAVSVIFATIVTGYLVNKWLNQQATESDRNFQINTLSAKELQDLSAEFRMSIQEVADIRQELNALKITNSMRTRNG